MWMSAPEAAAGVAIFPVGGVWGPGSKVYHKVLPYIHRSGI